MRNSKGKKCKKSIYFGEISKNENSTPDYTAASSSYEKLRRTFNSTDASKKAKRIITICAQCKQSMCLPCFNEKNF